MEFLIADNLKRLIPRAVVIRSLISADDKMQGELIIFPIFSRLFLSGFSRYTR